MGQLQKGAESPLFASRMPAYKTLIYKEKQNTVMPKENFAQK